MRLSVKIIAAALCAFCGYGLSSAQAQPAQSAKPKAAVYIMGNPEGRDALRMAVNTFLVKSGKYQMVAVDAIEVVAKEQNRQMSGSVSDGDIAALGRDAGAEYVCVVERSDLDGYAYVATRMVSVQSKVAEFADMVDLPYGVKIVDIIQWQIGSMLGMAVGPKPTAPQAVSSGGRPAPVGVASGAGTTRTATSTIQGTIVPGGSLAQKLAWLQKGADSHNTYIAEVNEDENIAPNNVLEFKGGINIVIVIRGDGVNRTIRLSSHGTMFKLKENVTLILDNNITLRGHDGNTGRMVDVEKGTFKMNAGATITGNGGGGVSVGSGTFEMNGGTISDNGNSTINGRGDGLRGGGVLMVTSSLSTVGIFNMSGGTISGNTAFNGGGVFIAASNFNSATFNMSGGLISGNTAIKNGGGIDINSGYGGSAIFNMRGGTITSNTAREYGGGVSNTKHGCCYGTFNKTGGTITGYKSDPSTGNVVKDADGNVLARKGHTVYRDDSTRKETTAGHGTVFKCEGRDAAGPWDQ